MIASRLLFLCCSLRLVVGQGFPGPRNTQMENGQEVWKAQAEANDNEVFTYIVRTFQLRPTLVYNCAHAPSLCKTAGNYLGNGVTTATLHYDANQDRKDARRRQSCPDDWVQTHGCPEADQPQWKGVGRPTFTDVIMWQDTNGVRHPNRIADRSTKRDRNGNEITVYRNAGAVMSCDEWPAASWIEGGTGAARYCAPKGQKCGSKNAVSTDQDWQAQGHGRLVNWFSTRMPDTFTELSDVIFTFDFRMVTAAGDAHAVWLEAGGHKRYCYGPTTSGSDGNCHKDWDGDVPEP